MYHKTYPRIITARSFEDRSIRQRRTDIAGRRTRRQRHPSRTQRVAPLSTRNQLNEYVNQSNQHSTFYHGHPPYNATEYSQDNSHSSYHYSTSRTNWTALYPSQHNASINANQYSQATPNNSLPFGNLLNTSEAINWEDAQGYEYSRWSASQLTDGQFLYENRPAPTGLFNNSVNDDDSQFPYEYSNSFVEYVYNPEIYPNWSTISLESSDRLSSQYPCVGLNNEKNTGTLECDDYFWRTGTDGEIRCIVCNESYEKVIGNEGSIFSSSCGHLFCTNCLKLENFAYKCWMCNRSISDLWKIYA